MKISTLVAALVALASSSALADVEVYTIDPVHSGVTFKIRHLVGKVPGVFTTFSGEIGFDEDNIANSYAKATIQASSVDTRNEKRNAHLRTDDFFDVQQYPQITFTSKNWKKAGEDKFTVTGDLTMMGQTHSVTMDVELLGATTARDKELTGWVGKTTIDRTKWGMPSHPMVGDEVEIEIDIEAARQIQQN